MACRFHTQSDIARRFGRTQGSVNQWLNHDCLPSIELAEAARALQVELAEHIAGRSEMDDVEREFLLETLADLKRERDRGDELIARLVGSLKVMR